MLRDDEQLDLEAISGAPVVFSIWVMNSAVTSGRWPKIGKEPLIDRERETPMRFFKEDALTGELSVYWSDPRSGEDHETPATRSECEGMERAAVWSAEYVEDRLRDHFDGRPNKWVESLRLR
jgi:hypothetical protein